MFAYDYLALRLLRLEPREEWPNRGQSFSFLFPSGGVGTFLSATNNHPLARGDVLVLTEAHGGKVCPANGAGLAFGCFSLSLEHLYPLFGNDELSMVQDVAECFRTPRLYPASSPLAQECHRLLAVAPPGHHLDHRGQLLRVVTAILAVEFKEARRQRAGYASGRERMGRVFDELSAADIMGLSVGDLAGKFHCSARHLNRLFHEHFGFSVAALRMEMRLMKAVSLLRNRDAKVIHVAEECGFNHLGLFNSCFKHRFGTSPGRWRDANVSAHAQPPGLIEADSLCRMQAVGLCPWAGKPSSAQPASPRPDRLSPSRLLEVRLPSSPQAPQRRDAPVEVAGGARPGAAGGNEIGVLIARKLEAAVRTRLKTASSSTVGERQRFVNGAPTPSKTLA
jgi:AraC-like DNA-binding protein